MPNPQPSPEALADAHNLMLTVLDMSPRSFPATKEAIALAFDAFRLSTVGIELAQMILADCTDTTPQAWIDAATALVGGCSSASGTEEAPGVTGDSAPSVSGDVTVGDVEAVARAIHIARFDTPGARPVDAMGPADHEYCGRLARAAIAAMGSE